jgi:hypothetical protein
MPKDWEILHAGFLAGKNARNMDVLIAWPRSGALPEWVREENFSADE